MIKRKRSPSVPRRASGSALCRVLEGAHLEVLPRLASVLACIVLARTSEELARLRVLEGARCRG